jgi:RNA polymerase sigma factor (sigma-70 family)
MDTTERNVSLEDAATEYIVSQDPHKLEPVIEAAGDLIRYFSRLYGKGCDKDDLFQTGVIGLMKALQNYDPVHGAKFTTYASHLIMGEIRHLVRKQASYYRPGCIIDLQFKVDRVVEEYIKEYGDVPAYTYIAQQLNVKEESVAEVMRAGLVNFDDLDHKSMRSASLETFKLPLEDKLTLYQALRKLSSLQQKVVAMLFLQDMTQQQVADELGLTQKQVSRIKKSSLETMQEDLKVT